MKHRIVPKPAFDAVGWGLRTSTANGENHRAIPAFWGQCQKEGRLGILRRLQGSFGQLGLCANFDGKMEEFTYVIGVEAPFGFELLPGMVNVRVAEADYAVFECIGALPLGIQNGWREIMGHWFPESTEWKPELPVNFELYPTFPDGDPRGDPASPLCYTEIWIPVRRKG